MKKWIHIRARSKSSPLPSLKIPLMLMVAIIVIVLLLFDENAPHSPSSTLATPALLAILTALLRIYFHKVGVLSLDWLEINKDALAAISSLCSTVALVVASILAYYRFFRGRTLTTRAELSIDIDAISGPDGINLHSISVSAKNIGTVTIWDPQLVVILWQGTAMDAFRSLN